jgi:hypothetical protein
MKKILSLSFLISAMLLLSVQSFALEEEKYDDYDSIVDNLSTSTAKANKGDLFDFDSLALHFGFGFNNSAINLKSRGGSPSQVTMHGFQLGMGVDLFSPDYIAEIDYANYNPADKEGYSYKLREYDFKAYYHHPLTSFFIGKAGFGVGARELSINTPHGGSTRETTPIGQLFVGSELMLGRHLGFLTDLTYKNALSGGTAEKSSFDLALGVNGHF